VYMSRVSHVDTAVDSGKKRRLCVQKSGTLAGHRVFVQSMSSAVSVRDLLCILKRHSKMGSGH